MISKQLKKFIRDSGLTAYQLSKDTGVAQSTLSRFMAGKAGVNSAVIDKICKRLGLLLVEKQVQ